MCIALVVTPEGLPLAYEVFDGNRTDVTAVEEKVETLRTKYGHERRTWVMDRGMVSEENLDMLRAAEASYLVGTPKSMLKQFDHDLLEQDWERVEPEVEVKLRPSLTGENETFVLCRSRGRIEKEKAMRGKQRGKLEAELIKLKARIDAQTHTPRDLGTAERRVGRLLQKYSRAARFFQVVIQEVDDPGHKSGKRLTIAIPQDPAHREWAELSDGCYLLRTNLKCEDPKALWKIYIGLTQIEDSFRISKHNLGLRPIYHQKKDRTQAHILVCFLALVMWRTLQQWMEGAGLGTAPRKLLEEMAEVRSLDMVLPTAQDKELRLRTASKPEERLAILLQKLELHLPNRPKSIGNVVQTFQ